MKRLKPFWKISMFILIGFILGISTNINTKAFLENPQGLTKEKPSPSNWIKENQIKVTSTNVIIEQEGVQWAKFANTNSMDPFLDEDSNALQLIPKSKEDLNIGDIISYEKEGKIIIHRIIRLGNDGEWYAIAKGDNNKLEDPYKIRFTEIKKVLIGIIY